MRHTSQQTSMQAPFFVLVHRQRFFRQPIIELQILQRFAFFVLQGEYKKYLRKENYMRGLQRFQSCSRHHFISIPLAEAKQKQTMLIKEKC